MIHDARGLNADLHSHSLVSDGTLAPGEVARRAHRHGVQCWALTDHDEVSGLPEAESVARELGLRFVPGVEVSVSWGPETVHIVGLGIDYRHPGLLAGLAGTRGGREQRAHEMARQLAGVGIPDAYEGALAHVGNPDLISRTHFARHLVETGYCRDVSEVFDRYLSEGKPGFVPHRWARLADAVRWINEAGGLAVVAHPGRYCFSDVEMAAFLGEFRDLGGRGIEVVSGSQAPAKYPVFARYARDYGLLASRGSDFHGPGESDVELGAVEPLPDSVTPVWTALS